MVRFIWKYPVLILILFIVFSCGNHKSEKKEIRGEAVSADSNHVFLQFVFEINRNVYLKTNYGQPPQIAIWIENPDSSIVKTVWITYCTAKQEWKGKVECPVSLPFWEYRMSQRINKTNKGTTTTSGIDAVTKATPKDGYVSASILVPKQSRWRYYFEVNVSADYNKTFSYWSSDGLPDSEANGQPSLVYGGQIIANGISKSNPSLVGRTDQRRIFNELFTDLSRITSAKDLIGNIEVKSSFKL